MIKNLPELKYYSLYLIKLYPTGNRVWYLIPYEIMNPGWEHEIIYSTNYIQSPYGIYVYGRVINIWIKRLTSITPEVYYNKYIDPVFNIKWRYCPICGADVTFIKITRGYSRNCKNLFYCKGKLAQLYHPDIPDKLNSVHSQAKGRCTQFKLKGNSNDICAFYICWTYDYSYYKFGITYSYIEDRKRLFYGENKNYHIILTTYRDKIAELEYLVKIKLNQINEYINSNDIKFFNNILRNCIKQLNIKNLCNNNEFYINYSHD